MIQLGGFLGKLLAPLLKTGLLLIRNVFKTLAKSVLAPLGLTTAVTATNGAIQKKFFGYGMAALVFSNEDLNDIMKIIKLLEGSGLQMNGVSETIKNEAKE